jgi:LPS export ABC transporter protein LptC
MLIIALLSVAVMGGCTEPETPVPQSTTIQIFPSSEATNATTVFLTESTVTTKIQSGRIISYADQDSAWAYALHVDFYNRLGQYTSTLIADSALIREKARLLEGFGNVRIVTDDGRTLDSPHLAWNDTERLITTDSLVTITRGEDVMKGYGFSSDPELSRIKMRRQVSGRITDTDELDDSL